MKKQVLEIVKNAMAGAEDNLFRANRQFGNMTEEELDKKYGQSGKKCGEILSGYQDHHTELKRCVAWVKGHITDRKNSQ